MRAITRRTAKLMLSWHEVLVGGDVLDSLTASDQAVGPWGRGVISL